MRTIAQKAWSRSSPARRIIRSENKTFFKPAPRRRPVIGHAANAEAYVGLCNRSVSSQT
jgi:hypothetical protein